MAWWGMETGAGDEREYHQDLASAVCPAGRGWGATGLSGHLPGCWIWRKGGQAHSSANPENTCKKML